MASIISAATSAAHAATSASAALLQIKTGSVLPTTAPVKELDPTKSFNLDTTGKIIIVGVPGAFTSTCSSQVPGFIADYDKFAAKGVKEIYVVGVNDTFVMQAWAKKLAEEGTKVRFIADDTGAFVTSLGLIFDASALLGAPRSKRFALVAENGTVSVLAVEDSPGDLKVTTSDEILAKL